MMTVLFAICIFVAVWMGIIFVGCALNKTLSTCFPAMNILLLALSVTGIITHIIGMW